MSVCGIMNFCWWEVRANFMIHWRLFLVIIASSNSHHHYDPRTGYWPHQQNLSFSLMLCDCISMTVRQICLSCSLSFTEAVISLISPHSLSSSPTFVSAIYCYSLKYCIFHSMLQWLIAKLLFTGEVLTIVRTVRVREKKIALLLKIIVIVICLVVGSQLFLLIYPHCSFSSFHQ